MEGSELRLKRVEMIGFKSFMDKTVLDFRDGITTVLGPNGCGKSNVVDAVRWVLGEQSAKQLRGEKMEDVIFKGTRKRKPMSMARSHPDLRQLVAAARWCPTTKSRSRAASRARAPATTSSTRRQCRLKDIKDLFYDTGVGNNAYSVIEQEVVGQVLDPNENKVRTMLEEGSGIVRYKIKRKETLRKLDLTERDLLRVEDIVEEIGKQVRSLARQVGKARRHQRLFGEVQGARADPARTNASSPWPRVSPNCVNATSSCARRVPGTMPRPDALNAPDRGHAARARGDGAAATPTCGSVERGGEPDQHAGE